MEVYYYHLEPVLSGNNKLPSDSLPSDYSNNDAFLYVIEPTSNKRQYVVPYQDHVNPTDHQWAYVTLFSETKFNPNKSSSTIYSNIDSYDYHTTFAPGAEKDRFDHYVWTLKPQNTGVGPSIMFKGRTGQNASYNMAEVRATGDIYGGNLKFFTANNNSSYGLTNRMTITNVGNVGIGTQYPTAKLDVAGKLHVIGNSNIDGCLKLITKIRTDQVSSSSFAITNQYAKPSLHIYNREVRNLGTSNTTNKAYSLLTLEATGLSSANENLAARGIKLIHSTKGDGWFIGSWEHNKLAISRLYYNNSTDVIDNVTIMDFEWKSNSLSSSITNVKSKFQVNGADVTSDDRIKFDELVLTNALRTINKLSPLSYRKAHDLNVQYSQNLRIEYGLIAQDIYNNVPELRHVVHFQKDLPRNFVNNDLNNNCIEDLYEREYNSDGTYTDTAKLASVSYNDIFVLTIKAVQELSLKVESIDQRVITLETNKTQQDSEIAELKAENIEMKSIIDKLKTSNSFEEFKNSL